MKEGNNFTHIFEDNKIIVANHVQDFNQDTIDKTVLQMIENSQWNSIIKSNMKVMLKPNFTVGTSRAGVTTSPLVLRSVVKVLSKMCKEITIMEGNGGSWSCSATEAAKNHGVFDLIREYGVKWVNVSEIPVKKITKKILGKNVSINLPEKIEDLGDLLISLPVFKNHSMTKTSLGIKNLWGLVPTEMRNLYHSQINRYLPLIADYYNFKLTLIDGLIGLEGNGPIFGDPVEMKTLLAGNDPSLVDILGSWLIKVNPLEVNHIVKFSNYHGVDLNKILSSIPKELENFQHELKMKRTTVNYLDLLTFKSRWVAKIVFDSSLTSIIYKLVNKINRDHISLPPKKHKAEFEKKFSTKSIK